MKKTIWLFSIAALMICLLVLANTYALFETNASGVANAPVGNWVIKVNNQDISLQQTIYLNNFTYSANAHTEDYHFAPGRTAEFSVIIDSSQSDVSVMYDLTIDDSEIEDYPNIYFTIVDMDTNQAVQSNNYTGVIYANSQNRVKTLKITLVWSDNAQYNESDTSLIDSNLSFNIDANFVQYTGS